MRVIPCHQVGFAPELVALRVDQTALAPLRASAPSTRGVVVQVMRSHESFTRGAVAISTTFQAAIPLSPRFAERCVRNHVRTVGCYCFARTISNVLLRFSCVNDEGLGKRSSMPSHMSGWLVSPTGAGTKTHAGLAKLS